MKLWMKWITGLALVSVLVAACSSAPAPAPSSSAGSVGASSAAPVAVQSSPSTSELRLYQWTGDKSYRSPRNVTIDASSVVNQAKGLVADWYKDAAFYHLWVKSFSDYDGDGCGDFRGVTAKLDYIKNDLGCDAIWLSPIFDCAGKGSSEKYNMHGYDTVDFYNVNDYFGNEEQVETLLAEAHKRGMKVIFDYVPNLTSNQCPWFVNSSKMEDGKKDWYLWNDERLAWNPMGNTNTWYKNIDRQAYYYSAYNASMPDLNFRNYEVREEMKNVVRYWLNKGFDGLRIDSARYIVENPGSGGQKDQKETHEFFQELRRDVLEPYAALGSPKFMICESWINGDRNALARYFGTAESPEFQMAFDFDFTGQVSVAAKFRNPGLFDSIVKWSALEASGNPGHIAYFLSNHDNAASRPGSSYTDLQLKLATAMELLQPGTPFVYYANEIGQKNASGYTGEDIRLRYPLDWSVVDGQKAQGDSILNLHRALLEARRQNPAIRRGSASHLTAVEAVPASLPAGVSLPSANDVQATALSLGGKTVLCVYNLSSRDLGPVSVSLDAPLTAKVAGAVIGKATASVSADGSIVTVSGLGPSGFGVYLLGEKAPKNYYEY
jgi:Glycosidases